MQTIWIIFNISSSVILLEPHMIWKNGLADHKIVLK